MLTWVDTLIREYNAGKRQLIAYRKTLARPSVFDRSIGLRQEIALVDGMISDLQYSLAYMRTGRRPGAIRGYDSNDAYRYAELRDMDLIPALDLSVARPDRQITDDEKLIIIKILLKLSSRERQCFLLHTVNGLSYADISKELKIKKASVQTNIKRARDKIGRLNKWEIERTVLQEHGESRKFHLEKK